LLAGFNFDSWSCFWVIRLPVLYFEKKYNWEHEARSSQKVKQGTCQKPNQGTKIGARTCLYAFSCQCFFSWWQNFAKMPKKKTWLLNAL
jgi:hypothetical protein